MSPEQAIATLRDKTISLSHADSDRIADSIQQLCNQLAKLQQPGLLPAPVEATSELLAVDGLGMHVVQFASEAEEIAALRAELARVARPAGVHGAGDLEDGELEVLNQIAAASAAGRDLNVHRSVLASLALRGYLVGTHFCLTRKGLGSLGADHG